MLLRSPPSSLLPLPSPPSSFHEFLSFYFSIFPSHRPSSPWPKTKFSSLSGSGALEDEKKKSRSHCQIPKSWEGER